jgi:hypothetical protein
MFQILDKGKSIQERDLTPKPLLSIDDVGQEGEAFGIEMPRRSQRLGCAMQRVAECSALGGEVSMSSACCNQWTAAGKLSLTCKIGVFRYLWPDCGWPDCGKKGPYCRISNGPGEKQ